METQRTDAEIGKKGGGSKGIVIVALVVVVAILIGVIVYLVMPKEEEKRNKVVTQDNVEEIIDEMDQSEFIEPGYYRVSMTNDWHFPDGKSASTDAYVENVVSNTNDVYFDIFLADDEEHAILESPIIPIGGSMKDITLDEDLDAGTYDCVMVYHLIDDDQNTLSTLRITLTITVEG
jgi:predicted metalloprotease